MLRITTHKLLGVTSLKLEGRLAGPWVHELERIWLEAVTDPTCESIVVDLRGVTFVDAKARELLTRVYCRGARFKTVGFLVKSVVEEIKGECERARQELLHDAR
jgi:anti-anti-sigma regulatory factor